MNLAYKWYRNFKYLSLLLAMIWGNTVFAQKVQSKIICTQVPTSFKGFKNHLLYKDSSECMEDVLSQIQKKIYQGYFELSIDSVRLKASSEINQMSLYIHVGRLYNKVKVLIDEENRPVLEAVKSKYFRDKEVDAFDIEEENKKIITYLENKGYPYSSVQLEQIDIQGGNITAKLAINKGQWVTVSSVEIMGNVRVSSSFLRGYTGLKKGDAFNFSKIKEIEASLNQLKFAQLNGHLSLEREAEGLKVILPLKAIKNNRFDGVVGLSSVKDGLTSSKLMLTGNLNVSLNNVFRQSESIDFSWKRVDSSSQTLSFGAVVPYLLNTNLGLDARFSLLKQSEDYLNTSFKGGVNYYYQGQNYLGIQYKRTQSNILNNENEHQDIKNYSVNTYGLAFFYSTLNRLFNPTSGFSLKSELEIGSKKNRSDTTSNQRLAEYTAACEWQYFVNLYKHKHILLLRQTSAFLKSESIFKNQMYRIGGLKSLRGFLESSIYASSYVVSTLEYRFAFEKQSAFYVFCDWAWFEKRMETYYYDYPIGLGIGVFFRTPAGIFTISYALGQKKKDPFSIKDAKVHFGLINQF